MRGVLIILSVFLWSCTDTATVTPSEYMKWLSDQDNGLIKTSEVAGLRMKVKYMPNEYLVYKDIRSLHLSADQHVQDSLMALYENGIAFLFTLGPEKEESGDIMLANVNNEQEFNQRVIDMNFEFDQFVRLEVDGDEVAPALTSLDNIYGLKQERSVYVLFADEDRKIRNAEKFIFVFDDRLFNTGKSRFKYLTEDLKKIPKLDYSTVQ